MMDLLARGMTAKAGITVTPDSGGNSGPLLNATLQRLSAAGGGMLTLSRGEFLTNETIVLPTNCGIQAQGKQTSYLSKGSGFPDGNTLLNGSGAGTSTRVLSPLLRDFQLRANPVAGGAVKAGLLLSLNYSSTGFFSNLRFSGAPNAALEMIEGWDHWFFGTEFNNCGGTSGDSDAALRILGSPTDKSNLIRFVGLRCESFRNCAVFISEDGNGANNAPYWISFLGAKFESNLIGVNNATYVKGSLNSASISLRDTYMQFGAAAARTGLRGIDCEGPNTIIDGMQANIGSNVTVTSIIRLPRASGGGMVRSIRTTGNSTLTQIIEADHTRSDSNAVVYNERAMVVDDIKPFGSVPLIGGPAIGSTAGGGARFLPLYGTPATTLTAGRTIRRDEINRVLPFNHASTPGSFVIPPEPNAFGDVGDVITVSQEGAAAATISPFSGVTLQVPSGLSATTSGQFSQVRARKVATNIWRIF